MNKQEIVTVVLAAISFLIGGIFILLNFLFVVSDVKQLQIENCIESSATINLSKIRQVKWVEIVAAISGALGQTVILVLHFIIVACFNKEQVTDKFYQWMICIHFWLILSSGIMLGQCVKFVKFSSELLSCATQQVIIQQFLNISLVLTILACEQIISAIVRAIFLIRQNQILKLDINQLKVEEQQSNQEQKVPQISLKIVDSSNQALEEKQSGKKEYIISEKPSMHSSEKKEGQIQEHQQEKAKQSSLKQSQQKKRKIFGRILHPFQQNSRPFDPQHIHDCNSLNQLHHQSVVEKYEISPKYSEVNDEAQSQNQIVVPKNSQTSTPNNKSRHKIFSTVNNEEHIKLMKPSQRIYD